MERKEKYDIRKILENLKDLIGKDLDFDDIICAFEDFEETEFVKFM